MVEPTERSNVSHGAGGSASGHDELGRGVVLSRAARDAFALGAGEATPKGASECI